MTNHTDKIRQIIQETADLMQPFSLSFSQKYAATSADRVAVAREFWTSQEHTSPDFEAVASVAMRVAMLEREILNDTSTQEGKGR